MRYEDLAWLADPDTESYLLPQHMVRGTNRAEIRQYKLALRVAFEMLLTTEQRELLYMRYWQNITLSDIAGLLGVQPSTVSKRVKKAEEVLARQLGFYRSVRNAQVREGTFDGGD